MIDTTIISKKHKEVLLVEIYQSGGIGFFQCDKTDKFYLIIKDEYFAFRVCEFIVFKRKILDINLSKLFDLNSPDYHCINMVHCKRLLLLSISELLILRKVIEETITQLKLKASRKMISK